MSWARIFGLVAIGAAIAGNANAQSPGRPLFDALKTFCVDTRAVPKAVAAAVMAAGGKPHNPPGGSTANGSLKDAPFPLAVTFWDVTLGGHNMRVSAGTAYPSRQIKSAQDFNNCDISSLTNEDASIEAIRDWVGVQPQTSDTTPHSDKLMPDFTQYHYAFQLAGTTHVIISSQAERASAERDGREWALVLMRTPNSGSFQLINFLPISPQKSN